MMKRGVSVLLAGYFSLSLVVAQPLEPGAHLQQSGQVRPGQTMPKFDNEPLIFALLTRGEKWTADKTPETARIQEGHMANIRRMAGLGKLVAAGPMGDDGDLRGIFIFRGASLDEAKQLSAEDPAIKVGRLKIELFEWWGSKGIGAKYAEEAKKGSPDKIQMVQHFLGLYRRGDKSAAEIEKQQQQLAHLWHLRKQMDTGKILAAGPFGGDNDLLGVVVLQAATLDEARALADQDPGVKSGLLKIELHPWWVAKGVMP
jgi:uncharacterized protein YciI